MGGVQDAVRIVTGERSLVGPVVAKGTQFADEAAFGMSEGHSVHFMPRFPHHAQEGGTVHVMEGLGRVILFAENLLPLVVLGKDAFQLLAGLFLVAGDELAGDEGSQTDLKEIHGELDAFFIGCCH